MILIQHTIISDDIAEQFFVCQLEKCKGACCVAGDMGAPLAPAEEGILTKEYDQIAPYLTPESRALIAEQGTWVVDPDGDHATPVLPTGECVYATRDDRGTIKCGIEQAHRAGATAFIKPISCHLYPIRITSYDAFDALNYDRWEICQPACAHGAALGVPIYQFLKAPLIRKYGEAWYQELAETIAGERPPQPIPQGEE